jgi:hypothetical protein
MIVEQPKRKKGSYLFSIIMMVIVVIVVVISGNHTKTGTSNNCVLPFVNENPNDKI